MIETWDGIVDEARAMAAEAQEQALTRLQAEGVRIVRPSDAVLAGTRARLMAHQREIVSVLGIDPAIVAAIRAALDE